MTDSGASIGEGNSAGSVTVQPIGKFADVRNFPSGSVSAFSTNPFTFQLGKSFVTAVAAGVGAASITVDAAGKVGHAAIRHCNDIRTHSIKPGNGSLAFVSITAAGNTPQSTGLDGSSRNVCGESSQCQCPGLQCQFNCGGADFVGCNSDFARQQPVFHLHTPAAHTFSRNTSRGMKRTWAPFSTQFCVFNYL